ncbi:hypothetical protein Tco_0516012, partial [Tanacetum coccineum]
KEYIGMAKVYYEEAKRSKHGKPGIVGGNCIGDAGNGRPQGDARMEDAEVEEGKPVTPSNLSMQRNVEYPKALHYWVNSTRAENDN